MFLRKDDFRGTNRVDVLPLQDDVDKDLLSHELEQAISKLNWYNEKFKDYADLQSNMEALTIRNQKTEQDLARAQAQQAKNEAVLLRVDQYEETIARLQEEIDQFQSKRNQEELGKRSNQTEIPSVVRHVSFQQRTTIRIGSFSKNDNVATPLPPTTIPCVSFSNRHARRLFRCKHNSKTRFDDWNRLCKRKNIFTGKCEANTNRSIS